MRPLENRGQPRGTQNHVLATPSHFVADPRSQKMSGPWFEMVSESKRIHVKLMIIPLGDIQEAFQELLKPDTTWVQAVAAFE